MRTILMAGVLILSLTAGTVSAETTNTFISRDHGFSIEAPLSPDSRNQGGNIVMFFLPVTEAFAANIGVIKQGYDGSIEAYDKLNRDQYKIFGFTVLNRKISKNEAKYEFIGTQQGKAMHYYARAVATGQNVYVVTAVSLESYWQKQRVYLIKSVDSFSLQDQTGQ